MEFGIGGGYEKEIMPDAKVHKTEKTFEKRKPPWGKNHQ
jgi:hypothetical protein